MAVTRGLLFLRTPLLFFFFYRTVIFFSSLFRVKLDDAQTRKKDKVPFLEMMIPQDRTYKSVKAAFFSFSSMYEIEKSNIPPFLFYLIFLCDDGLPSKLLPLPLPLLPYYKYTTRQTIVFRYLRAYLSTYLTILDI